jgi:hypothetical protein
MPSPAEFADSMRKLAETIKVNVDAGFRATVLAIDAAVVTSTPVDTGRARSNWRVSTEKQSDVYDAYVKGLKGSQSGPNTQAAVDQAREAVDAAPPDADTMYISNNLPYIQALNDGSSAQAPAGFVELAIQAGEAEVNKIKALG